VSLKDDINGVKKELSAQESFLESFLKFEQFYKKYKKVLIGAIAILILATIGYYVNDYIETNKKIEVNKHFNAVLNDPSNTVALEALKKQDQQLYNIALMMQGKSTQVNNKFLDQLLQYTEAIKEESTTKLSSVAQNQEFLIKDFALLNKAILEVKEGKYTEAKSSLALIPQDSDIQSIAKMLQQFLLAK
jgi:hypothetical protein